MAYYKNYNAYLSTVAYRGVRACAMRKAGGKCERCGLPATEVNHKQYPIWGTWDVPSNMEAICHECHCKEHGKQR